MTSKLASPWARWAVDMMPDRSSAECFGPSLPLSDGSAASPKPESLTAVLTCFNRKAMTLACLAHLRQAASLAGVALRVVVVDDCSTDGTADAVRAEYAEAQLVAGTGQLFWNRGMHLGLATAMQRPTDYLLWLNDDTLLEPLSLRRLLAESRSLAMALDKPVLLVGATADEQGRISYGGSSNISQLKRFEYRRVWDANTPLPCEVINGNCVLVPWAIAQSVGNLDPVYEHAMGDTDYALRTARAGFPVYAASGVAGRCSNNERSNTYNDQSLSLIQRWRHMQSRKGLPWRSWWHFTRLHAGPFWPAYFAWPYFRLLIGKSEKP